MASIPRSDLPITMSSIMFINLYNSYLYYKLYIVHTFTLFYICSFWGGYKSIFLNILFFLNKSLYEQAVICWKSIIKNHAYFYYIHLDISWSQNFLICIKAHFSALRKVSLSQQYDSFKPILLKKQKRLTTR